MGDLFGTAPVRTSVISLWQPWASLCFVADPILRKLDETRHWQYPARLYGERIAIHAAVRFPSELDEDLIAICESAFGIDFWHTLPVGALLGTVRLGNCRPTGMVREATTAANRAAGNFADFTIVKGVRRPRYAWALHEPEALPQPVPMRGKQGWSSIDLAQLQLEQEIAS